MDSLRRAEGPRPRSAGEKTLSAAEGSTQRMASAPKSGSIARSERPGQFLITMLACSALALVALGLASPVSASFSAERADARAILAKFSNSGPRSPDGCATGCGMIMDAFASGYCVKNVCRCLPGWTGDICTELDGEPPIPESGCDPRCGSGVFWATGTCTAGTCVCEKGWGGNFCGLNEEYPLSGGLLANLPNTKTKGGKENTKPTDGANAGGCPYYPLASGAPMKCGPAHGNARCPDQLCCSAFGYCGGRLRSFSPVRTSKLRKRWHTAEDEPILIERLDEAFDGQRYFDLELPSPTAPLSKRAVGAEPEDANVLEGAAPRASCYGARSFIPGEVFAFRRTPWEKRNCGKLSLAKRDFMCGENGSCCSARTCVKMSKRDLLKRTNGNSCIPTNLPPCPPTPPEKYCGDGCQPNYGKCYSSTASCTGTVVPPTKTGASETTTTATTQTGITAATPGTSTTTQAVTTASGGTTTSSAASPTSVANITTDIFATMFQIVDGRIPKPYKIDQILSAVNLAPLVKEIVEGKNPAYPNISFFAVINEGSGDLNNTESITPQRRSERLLAASLGPEHHLAVRQTTEPTAAQNPGDVLRYNIVQAFLDPATLPGKVLAPTLLNSTFNLAKVDPQYLVVTRSDAGIFPYFGVASTEVIDNIVCTNGILYITKELVRPPVWPTTTMNQSNLTDFLAAVETNDLAATYNGFGRPGQPGATFFVPVNEAFVDNNETLSDLTPDEYISTLNSAVVISGQGAFYSSDLVDGLTLTTVSGEVLTIAVEEGAVSVNGISTVILDILTSNGVIHVIDDVIFPESVGGRSSSRLRNSARETALREFANRHNMNSRAVKMQRFLGAAQGIYNAQPITNPKGQDTSGLWDASAGGDSD